MDRCTHLVEEINFAIAHLGEWMRSEPVEAPLLLADTASEIRREPKGQNPHPRALQLPRGAPYPRSPPRRLAAGNVIIVKPLGEGAGDHLWTPAPALARRVRRGPGGNGRGRGSRRRGPARASLLLHLLHRQHPRRKGRDGRRGEYARLRHAGAGREVACDDRRRTPRCNAPRTPSPGASSSTPVRPASRPITPSCRRDSAIDSSTVSGRRLERSYGPESGWATNPELARLVDSWGLRRGEGPRGRRHQARGKGGRRRSGERSRALASRGLGCTHPSLEEVEA